MRRPRHAVVHLGESALELRADRCHNGLCALTRAARRQPRQDAQRWTAPIVQGRQRQRADRHVRTRRHEAGDRSIVLRQDAGYREQLAVEDHRLADRVRIGAEAGIPVRMIEDNHSRGTLRRGFSGAERSAESCTDAEAFEEVVGHHQHAQALELVADAAIHRRHSEPDDVGERSAVAEVAVILIGELTAVSGLDADDRSRVRHGRLMPKDRRHAGVEGQVEPDSETERQDADGHEPRRPSKIAGAVSKILGQGLD